MSRPISNLQSRLPTPRGWAVLGLAGLFYFFANQTQVNWLYVFTALTLGLWLVSAFTPGRMLRGLTLKRRINGDDVWEEELYVGETVAVELELRNAARLPALHVRGEERCPFAPAEDRALPFFVNVPGRGAATLRYEAAGARRGWFEFPPVTVRTRAPFGFFAARRELAAPGGLLIFPEYRRLERFPLLERRPALHQILTRIGQGAEFVGVREYRPGDSPRHVHWRTTARAGRLMVKEFAEDTQPGLTLALDLRAESVLGPEGDNTLERAIKVAATLADYADRRGLPVTLAANSRDWPTPLGPLSRWAAFNWLARVQPGNASAFFDCLHNLHSSIFIAALLPALDESAAAALIELKKQGREVLAVLVDPTPFRVELTGRAEALADSLRAAGVSVRVIGDEPDWARTLAADERTANRF
jgi:uncharacterized protein (DUF58 family)